MSRGYGYVQRFVLAELDQRWAVADEWIAARALAESLDGAPPTRRACRSVRRALRRLAADGLVEIGDSAATHDGTGRRASQTGRRERMFVRVAPASAVEVAERGARRARARDLRQAVSGTSSRFEINDQGADTHVAAILSARARP